MELLEIHATDMVNVPKNLDFWGKMAKNLDF